jgi:hypothetical protein
VVNSDDSGKGDLAKQLTRVTPLAVCGRRRTGRVQARTGADLPHLRNTPLLRVDGEEHLVRRIFLDMLFEELLAVEIAVEAGHAQRMAAILGSALQPGPRVRRAFVAVGRGLEVAGKVHPLAQPDPGPLGVQRRMDVAAAPTEPKFTLHADEAVRVVRDS